MDYLESKTRFKPVLTGMPDLTLIQLPKPATVAASAMDIPYIRPKLMVKENDPVKIGTPLFHDKRNPLIQWVSPGSGHVKRIVFGQRRRLIEVVISLDKEESWVRFDPIRASAFSSAPKTDIVTMLQQGGVWQFFREFPAKDTADADSQPPMIIVSLHGNDIFSPHPALALKDRTALFASGLDLLKRFSNHIVVTARKSALPRLGKLAAHVTHTVSDTYPSWNPGVVLYQLKTGVEDNRSWCISAEHLMLMVQFLTTGQYPVQRVVTVTRGTDKKPHALTRQGAPVAAVIGRMEENTLITTGLFNGRSVPPDTHLGFFDTTLNVLANHPDGVLFGFIRPGLNAPTASRTFLSCLTRSPRKLDSNIHGEERACINCGYCTRICPVDLAPGFIMKALHSDDIEDALDLGLLDCVSCGLCTYACPSKIELNLILSNGMDAHYKDKQ